jgi:hypothetical protein
MPRHALWALALMLLCALSAGPAHAGRGHVAVIVAVNRPFFHPFFHPFFFPHPFFAPPVFVPPPIVAAPPVVVYAPPPPPVAYPNDPAGPTAAPQNCRQVQLTFTVGGRPQSAPGTACLQPDGSWRILQ